MNVHDFHAWISRLHRPDPGQSITTDSSNSIVARRHLYAMTRHRAKRKGVPFAISSEAYVELTRQPCSYCGSPPTVVSEFTDKRGRGYRYACTYNEVDRSINDLGYVDGNCVASCHACNMAKRTRTEQEFISWASRVYDHLKV
jgi:hypothetical protein